LPATITEKSPLIQYPTGAAAAVCIDMGCCSGVVSGTSVSKGEVPHNKVYNAKRRAKNRRAKKRRTMKIPYVDKGSGHLK
jgi:hypothetical protein